ncbi:MAG: hypothetical protein PHP52_14750 [Bacteroidales bacterium]|nr:hypothetical protein [Bacteroidales bacterium]MDD4218324.1 hypothetical protein [Bacteroidales bacterium]
MKKIFKSSLYLSFLIVISFSVFSKSNDTTLISFDDDKYINEIIDIIQKKTIKHNIVFNNICNRKTNRNGNNILIIPQFIASKDTICSKYYVKLDTVNPINSAILFKKNKYFGTLLFWNNDTIFCPRKIDNVSHFDCGKNIYAERHYLKSLNKILDMNPKLIFKIKNIDRAWFFVSNSNKVSSLTYDLKWLKVEEYFEESVIENHSINQHLKIRDIYKKH